MQLINGDCLTVLKTLDDNSIDSLITDPPAGISFMGKAWDSDKGGRAQWIAWMAEIMEECLRVLKPGAHGLVWALPRTSHWTASALEQAGFEIRDVVVHIFGSGFPKSMDISKAMDKAAGAERDVVGEDPQAARRNKTVSKFASTYSEIKDAASCPITAPATDEAKQWQGWGTALKPANEHWILVRKPLGEKTVAKNVLKHGTGGLDIDASRIGNESITTSINKSIQGGRYGSAEKTKESQEKIEHQGRFPANLILSHHADCELLGAKEIGSGLPGISKGEVSAAHTGYQRPNKSSFTHKEPGHVKTKGKETIPDYRCHDECAVAELDRQSGILLPQGGRKKKDCPSATFSGGSKDSTFYGDTGGASRFFYCAKASKRDKGADNTHPTVKSTKLMEYLIKLITPPGGIVLDCFMGSGSTGVAAKREGFGFVGIEKDSGYFDIAAKRINP